MNSKSLYQRLGGYDGIAAFTNDLLPRLQTDPKLGRFWQNRGDDGIEREHQLLIDYLCASAGGPMYYTGRNMKTTHKGMKISESDWSIFLEHAGATMKALLVPQQECDDVAAFVLSLKEDIVEAQINTYKANPADSFSKWLIYVVIVFKNNFDCPEWVDSGCSSPSLKQTFTAGVIQLESNTGLVWYMRINISFC